MVHVLARGITRRGRPGHAASRLFRSALATESCCVMLPDPTDTVPSSPIEYETALTRQADQFRRIWGWPSFWLKPIGVYYCVFLPLDIILKQWSDRMSITWLLFCAVTEQVVAIGCGLLLARQLTLGKMRRLAGQNAAA